MLFSNISKKSYDLNSLLIIVNIFIYGLIICLYNLKEDIDLINISTIFLIGFFVIENIGMLLYEKKRRNPFIIILVLVITVFYIFRIATLILMPSSGRVIYQDQALTASDLNYSLIFIILSNFSMFLGFYCGRIYTFKTRNILSIHDAHPKVLNAIIIILLCVLVQFFNLFNPKIFGRISLYIQALVMNLHIIVLFAFSMLIYHYDKIMPSVRKLLIILFSALVILLTLSGSRAGVLTVGMLLLISTLVVKQRAIISGKAIIFCLILIPISLILFVSATMERDFKINGTNPVFSDDFLNIGDDRIKYYLDLLFFRLGYLDYSTELIADSSKFEKIINVDYYFKSIIDNALTPGFDFFDITKASHALNYVRRGEPIPDRNYILEHYQADQMGIYGEYFVLFSGYPALAVFFCVAFIFQRAFLNLMTANVLRTYLYRTVLINLFYIHLNSFGIDWFVISVETSIITTALFARYFASRQTVKIQHTCLSKL